jgi:hypothetical protein
MPVITKRWEVVPPLPQEALSELGEFHPVLRQILYSRGYHTKESALAYLQAIPPSGTEPENLPVSSGS